MAPSKDRVLATPFGEVPDVFDDGDGDWIALPPVGLEAVGVGAMLSVVLVTTPLNGPLELLPP